MRRTFQAQGVKGVVIVCERCEENHYYEWDLLLENLEHMLQTGESQMHEPAFEVREEEYIQWDYGKGYVDALADTGLEPDNRVEVTRCPWCETPADAHFQFCPEVRPVVRGGPRLPGARRSRPGRARGPRDARARGVRTLLALR